MQHLNPVNSLLLEQVLQQNNVGYFKWYSNMAKALSGLWDKEQNSRSMLPHVGSREKAVKDSMTGPTYILRCGIHLGLSNPTDTPV